MIAVGVLETENPVDSLSFLTPTRIAEALCHPDPTAVVEAEGDGLDDIRFASKKMKLEPGRQGGLGDRILGTESGERDDVRRRRLGAKKDRQNQKGRKEVEKSKSHGGLQKVKAIPAWSNSRIPK
jgi:hypothetical protein